MNKTSVFKVTALGRALLEKPQGRITGDARLLMGLIDGSASVAEIVEKIPPSVRTHLPDIFNRLLAYGVIEEQGSAGSAAEAEYPEQASEEDMPSGASGVADELTMSGAEIEHLRRIELEQELQEVRSKLEATIARQQKIEEDYLRLTQQVSAYDQDKQTVAASGMHSSLESINQLNQALLEQQEILGNTLKLRAYQAQLDAKRHHMEFDTDDAKDAQLHPHYKTLRGLEFFRGFSNKELLDFLKVAKWQEAKEGDMILGEGEIGMSFYVLISGSVDICRKENLLTSLNRGDFFGEFAYLSGEEPVRSARAIAKSDCELLVVDPLDIEFSPVQLRLRVVEALLRGEVRRALLSDQRIDSLSKQLE